jgi:ferrous iron transport protein A
LLSNRTTAVRFSASSSRVHVLHVLTFGSQGMTKDCPNPNCPRCEDPLACPLHRLGVGRCGRVVGVGGDADLRRRLLEMGFCCGTDVQVIRRAPLGDPIEFRLRGYYLSLRAEQARNVIVLPAA